jgi:hypothetical protein
LHFVEAGSWTNVQQILKAGPWQTAPREIAMSPDGQQVMCLVANFDGSGRGYWQVWRHTLPRMSEWQTFTNQLTGGFVIQSPETKLDPRAQTWEMLYAVPTQP